jgi:UDP-N-acetylglucosamine 1-carboxyvinyltransferase
LTRNALPPTTLVVEGGARLEGRVKVEGNKNAALPLLAACLLTDEGCELRNMPDIRDAATMAEVMRGLGAEVEGVGTGRVRVRAEDIRSDEPDPEGVGRLRGSVLLAAPILARRGRVQLGEPGGDFAGRRGLDVHLAALRAMGVREAGGPEHLLEAPDGLQAASIYLEEASVTGTETALLAAAGADGVSEIRHAACEPHVVELCGFLKKMGVDIEGAGTPTLRVAGESRRRGAAWTLGGDFVEAGSWAAVAALTGGTVVVEGAPAADLEPIAAVLRRLGVEIRLEADRLLVEPSRLRAARRITTAPWPGFPSDLVSLTTVLATAAEGATLVHDWMYELRLFSLEQLIGMGADMFLCDPHRVIVTGPSALRGRDLDARDIRSGMALIAAALAASGESRIAPLETVQRGYSSLPEKLRSLGASVEVR